MKEEEKKYLQDIYFNPKKPSSFGGINKLYQYVKSEGKYNIHRKDIQKWLQSQEVHSTSRLTKHFIKRLKVISPYLDYMWDVDTASLNEYKKENKGFGYFILAIDIMSRFVWCEAVKTPSGINTRESLKMIFKKGRLPERIRTDKGTEFSNATVHNFLQLQGIKHFVTQNEVKSNYAERAIQTIKGKLMKYMRAKQTHHWLDKLEDFTKSYNNTIHRSIKQKPASVSKKDEVKLWNLLYMTKKPALPKNISFKFDIGDFVRISKLRHAFVRFYNEHWTNEIFIIKDRKLDQYIPLYSLTDFAKDPIKGRFYEAELQRVYTDENTTYLIDEVKKRRKRNGVRESLVSWKGWPEKFDSWIPSKDVVDFK